MVSGFLLSSFGGVVVVVVVGEGSANASSSFVKVCLDTMCYKLLLFFNILN